MTRIFSSGKLVPSADVHSDAAGIHFWLHNDDRAQACLLASLRLPCLAPMSQVAHQPFQCAGKDNDIFLSWFRPLRNFFARSCHAHTPYSSVSSVLFHKIWPSTFDHYSLRATSSLVRILNHGSPFASNLSCSLGHHHLLYRTLPGYCINLSSESQPAAPPFTHSLVSLTTPRISFGVPTAIHHVVLRPSLD